MDKFTVRMFHYIGGQLQVIEQKFEVLADAIEHGLSSLAHSFKVYGEDGCVCHEHDHGHGHHHGHHPYC